MKCNIMMMGFVKKTFKESHAKMVDRLVEKAHILESREANERLNQLKNVAPGERMGHGSIFIAPPPGYAEKPAYDDKPLPERPRESAYSDGSFRSQEPSPGLSQASTLTSQSEFSQKSSPLQYQRQHSQSLSQPQGPRSPDQYLSLASPPQPWQPGHSHSHSQDCNHRSSFPIAFDPQQSPGQPQPQMQTLPNLSYLPSTVYSPQSAGDRESQYQAYKPPPLFHSSEYLQPPPVELPAHMQDSPTLPRDLREDRDKRVSELPA